MFQHTSIAPTPQLAAASVRMVEAITRGPAAFPLLGTAAKTERLRQQIDAGAWTDAAVFLVALEAPDWHIRRIEWDDGEWFCSLTRNPAVPSEFDDAVEGRHKLLPLAIIDALKEAKRGSVTAPPPTLAALRVGGAPEEMVWCENCK